MGVIVESDMWQVTEGVWVLGCVCVGGVGGYMCNGVGGL